MEPVYSTWELRPGSTSRILGGEMNITDEKKRVLFICTHNSARSQIAEGLINAHYGSEYEAFSAGTEPSTVNPFAIKVMSEAGIDISGHKSNSLDEFIEREFDLVITVCDNAKETCPVFRQGKKQVHKSFKDPSAVMGGDTEKLEAFRRTRDEISAWMKKFFR